MRKYFAKRHVIPLCIIIVLLAASGVLLHIKATPQNAHAQTYTSINCPTSTEKSTLQMVPCTGSGSISNTPIPQQNSTQPGTTQTGATQSPVKSPITKQTPQSPLIPPTNQKIPTTTFKAPTPALKPGVPVCKPETQIINHSCQCAAQQDVTTICNIKNDATCSNGGGYPMYKATASAPTQCLYEGDRHGSGATNCKLECNGKPVIYFYSPTTRTVNVVLDIPGFVTQSIPTYPANGWQNVTVHPTGTPDGTLVYKGKQYPELYYEDETIKAQAPTHGFIIKTSDLTPSLLEYTAKLGLTAREQNEFIAYWVPKLTSLHAPYIFFTVFDQTQKDRVDHVIVSPKPDTTIAFLAYFKPLQKPVEVAPLQFPAVPKRVGFTMVEWGGTIDGAR